MEYFEIIILFFSFVLFTYYYFHDKNGFPSNWPIVGMFPALLKNVHRIHSYFIEILEKSNLTFYFEGPWFTNMNIIATINPSNVHHIMSKNFGNYPKGKKFNQMFDVLGEGIFNTDFMVWQYHRKMAQFFLNQPNFHQFLVKKTLEKVQSGLLPILDYASKHAIEIDLQDLFTRFTFDTISTIIMDYDPKSLAIDLPIIPSFKALDEVERVLFYRNVVPSFVWKVLRWLDIGLEKKYRKAWETLDSFIYNCINMKKEELLSKGKICNKHKDDNEVSINLLALYMKNDENEKGIDGKNGEKFLRDTILNFFIAGRDTTSVTLSWFFYLILKNPQVISKIKEEIDSVTKNKNFDDFRDINNNLIYLHGALCETLRLYPPVVFQSKFSIEKDKLPSGEMVNPNTQIIFNMYAMGRMKSIWGDDCYEFKPERWISEKGKIRHQPSYKFFAFNSGPRTCLGKEMAFTQMKIIIANIIQNYIIQVVEDFQVVPDISVILHMKHGFKVRVSHRL